MQYQAVRPGLHSPIAPFGLPAVNRQSLRANRGGPHPPHTLAGSASVIFRKEVIQPQVLLQLPCYDFTPIASHTMDGCLPRVGAPASGTTNFRDVTGGVYKARERIHGIILIRHY